MFSMGDPPVDLVPHNVDSLATALQKTMKELQGHFDRKFTDLYYFYLPLKFKSILNTYLNSWSSPSESGWRCFGPGGR